MGFFGGSDSSIDVVPQSAWQKQGISFLKGLVNQTPELPTQGIAGMSQAEQLGQGQLMGILAGEAFQDPRTSPLYQGLRAESMAQEQAGADQLRRRAQLGGAAMSSGAFGAESRYRQGMANSRLSQLGQLYAAERARDNPYTRMAAASQYGQLPRALEQAQMDAQHQSQLANMMFPYTEQANIASALMGHSPNMYQKAGSSSTFGSMLPILGMAAGAALGGGLIGPGLLGGGLVGGGIGALGGSMLGGTMGQAWG